MKRKIGFGSLSLILFLLAIVWPRNIKLLNNFCLGDAVLSFINLPTWSTCSNGMPGVHYTVYYTFVFFIFAIIAGHKFPGHIFAKSGKFLSVICALLLAFFCLGSIVIQV